MPLYNPTSGGTPGGSDTQLQRNNAGAFGGISGATTDGTSLTISSGNLKLTGATSGTTILNGRATGGGTLTLPPGTDTILGVASTATLTNKTFDTAGAGNSLSINGGSISATTGSGNTLVLNTSPTFQGTITLPDSTMVSSSGHSAITVASGTLALTSSPLVISGNISSAAWTTSGVRIKGTPGTLTDTSSSGTVAAAYTDVLGGNTIAASGATTFTNYYALYGKAGVAGANVTLTNSWGLGGDSLKVGTSGTFQVSTAGVLTTTGAQLTTPTLGVATATSLNGNTFTTGTYTLTGGSSKTLTFNNSLTLAGTDSTTLTFPSTSATIARTDAGQTFTGTNIFGITQATSLALGGATIGTDALGVTGTASISGAVSHGTETNTGNGAASVSQVLWNGTVFAGGTATNTFPAMFVQPAGTTVATTWSTSGTGLGMNLASGFAGNFLDFRVAGGTTLFTVTSGGGVNVKSTLNMGTQAITAVASLRLNANSDAQLTSPGTASVQLGASDAAVAVAQTLRVQSVVAGTAAANGANWTLIGSLPTGTGTSGDIIIQTGIKTGSGTTQGTATTALTIKGETQAVICTGSLTINASSAFIRGKATDPGTAPGSAFAKTYWVAGTNAGTAKLIAYAGTSTTPVTIVDNVGGSF